VAGVKLAEAPLDPLSMRLGRQPWQVSDGTDLHVDPRRGFYPAFRARTESYAHPAAIQLLWLNPISNPTCSTVIFSKCDGVRD
jgi:hypothetical protein